MKKYLLLFMLTGSMAQAQAADDGREEECFSAGSVLYVAAVDAVCVGSAATVGFLAKKIAQDISTGSFGLNLQSMLTVQGLGVSAGLAIAAGFAGSIARVPSAANPQIPKTLMECYAFFLVPPLLGLTGFIVSSWPLPKDLMQILSAPEKLYRALVV